MKIKQFNYCLVILFLSFSFVGIAQKTAEDINVSGNFKEKPMNIVFAIMEVDNRLRFQYKKKDIEGLSFEYNGKTISATTYIPAKREARLSTNSIFVAQIVQGQPPSGTPPKSASSAKSAVQSANSCAKSLSQKNLTFNAPTTQQSN